MKFAELPLTPSILKSLERMNHLVATEVQARTIPLILAGKDVLVTAQTGTGKTAAFTVPIMQKMIAQLEADEPVKRALVLSPTRELAEQTGTVLRELTFFYRRLRYAVVIGGAPYPKQFRELNVNPAFVVGTPGRIIDHIETGTLKLGDFDTLVLDEADRMLDMGFAPQIEMIVSKFPAARQTMMFSATLPNEVRGIVAKYLSNPSRVAVGEENKPVSRIKQDVVELQEYDKAKTLVREIDKVAGTMIVFTKTKLRADLVASLLEESGHQVAALHGDLTQSNRRRVTTSFRDGGIRILVGTDIAARGLDIDHVRHVFNYDLPMLPEDYIHRIGRTGRNGAEGHSVAFVTPQEKHRWGQIQKLIRGGSGGGGSSRGYKNAGERGAFSGSFEDARERGASGRSPEPRNRKVADSAKESSKRPAKPASPGMKKFKERSKATANYVARMRDTRAEFQSRLEKSEERKAHKLGRKPRFTTESNLRAAAKFGAGSGSGGGKSTYAGTAFNAKNATGLAQTSSAKKPHKGAPDTRKRKPNSRNSKPNFRAPSRG